MAGTVLVTGGSGYIASFLIQRLLADGWLVNTTVRDMAKEQRLRHALGAFDADRLRVFAADLTDDAGWAEAVDGCSHVAHVASPLPTGVVRHDDELIVPAREGVLRALRVARAAGVSRFVMTSSIAAIAHGHPRARERFTEADWTRIEGADANAYIKSKTIAERAARDWIAAEGAAMEFCTVNPSLVIGPVLSDDFSGSVQVVKALLQGFPPRLPNIGFGVVDVRDVAEMHAILLKKPGVADERFIASGRFYTLIDIANVLRTRLGYEARKVPVRLLPNWIVRTLAPFSASVRQIAPEVGRMREVDAGHAAETLGWRARPGDDTIVDTARSLIDRGLVSN